MSDTPVSRLIAGVHHQCRALNQVDGSTCVQCRDRVLLLDLCRVTREHLDAVGEVEAIGRALTGLPTSHAAHTVKLRAACKLVDEKADALRSILNQLHGVPFMFPSARTTHITPRH